MGVALNLRDVLEKNRQVSLPGLGSFYKKRINGYFDDRKKSFFPPHEVIEFKQETEEESSQALINHLSKGKSITENEARDLVQQYTALLKNTLHSAGEVQVHDLGTLKKKGDTVVLLPNETAIDSFFGLPSIPYEPVKNEPEFEPQSIEGIAGTVEEDSEEHFSLAEQAMSVAATQNEEDEEERRKPKTLIYVLLITIILLLGLQTLYFVRPDIIENAWTQLQQLQNKETTVAPIVEEDSEEKDIAIADSIYNSDILPQLEAHGFEAERVKDTSNVIIETQAIPNQNSARYEIVVSAWETETKANAEVKKYKEHGIDAKVVTNPSKSKFFHISVATLHNEQDALAELKRVRKELNPKAVYIEIK